MCFSKRRLSLVFPKLDKAQLNLALAEELQRLAPFGQGNPTPQFLSRNLTVIEDRRLGREGTHRRLTVQAADGSKAPVIWFNGADVELPSGPLDLVFTLGINEYRGERTLQLGYIANRPTPPETLEASPDLRPHRQLRGRAFCSARRRAVVSDAPGRP